MSEKIEQNFGNLGVSGVIIGLKEIKDYDNQKVLLFGIKTNTDRIVFVKAQGYKKEDNDTIYVERKVNGKVEKGTNTYDNRGWLEDGFEPSDMKLKLAADGEVIGYVAIDGVDLIKKNFKNGDSVFALLHTEINTHFNNIQFNVAQLYKSSNEINFESNNFVEKNAGRQWIVINEITDDNVTGFVFNKKEEYIQVDFKLNKDFMSKQSFTDNNLKQGSIAELDYEYSKIPQYEEVAVQNTKAFKPVGKYANSGNKKTKQVTGYEEEYICLGINNVKLDKFVDLTPFLTKDDSEEKPF